MSPTVEPRRTLVHRAREQLGGYHPVIRWYRQHRPAWLWLRLHAIGRYTARYTREHGLSVRRGPFAGMTYLPEAIGHVGFLPAKLLGSYEAAVVAVLAELGTDHDVFVDVGSGEGFYCVGMARLHPHLRVIGYETTVGERELAANMARHNGVAIEQRGTADHAELRSLPAERTLLLVDIEGYEHQLLDPDLVPELRQMSMVVELHDQEAPGIEGTLRARFGATHDIRLVRQADVDLGPFPELAGWSDAEVGWVTTERPGNDGVWMVLRNR